jgi:hypothetical protein
MIKPWDPSYLEEKGTAFENHVRFGAYIGKKMRACRTMHPHVHKSSETTGGRNVRIKSKVYFILLCVCLGLHDVVDRKWV